MPPVHPTGEPDWRFRGAERTPRCSSRGSARFYPPRPGRGRAAALPCGPSPSPGCGARGRVPAVPGLCGRGRPPGGLPFPSGGSAAGPGAGSRPVAAALGPGGGCEAGGEKGRGGGGGGAEPGGCLPGRGEPGQVSPSTAGAAPRPSEPRMLRGAPRLGAVLLLLLLASARGAEGEWGLCWRLGPGGGFRGRGVQRGLPGSPRTPGLLSPQSASAATARPTAGAGAWPPEEPRASTGGWRCGAGPAPSSRQVGARGLRFVMFFFFFFFVGGGIGAPRSPC